MISEKGELDFLQENKVITYEGLSKFIKKECESKKDNIKELQKELEKVDEDLEELRKEEIETEKEYKKKERQIATFLEYRKTFFGRIRYFFKKGKLNKTKEEEEQTQEEKQKNEKQEIQIEDRAYYTIENLLEICKVFESLNTELKNKMLDKKALSYKVETISMKLKNAIQYIEEIDQHKKSLVDFFKFANKDNVLGLVEGQKKEEVKEEKTRKKVFDYEEDYEELGAKLDQYQKEKFTKEECDSIYLATTEVVKDMNRLRQKEEKQDWIESLNHLKQKAQEQILSEDEFDIFGSVSEDHTKIKTLGNKKHREIKKNEIQLLDIRKNMEVEEYQEAVEKQEKALQQVLAKSNFPVDISVYHAQETVLNTDEMGRFHMNPKSAIEEVKDLDKINLYRINLKQGMPAIACSNIIYYDNKNQTLPDGMDVTDEVLIDMANFKFELKKQKLFRLNQEVDEIHRKSKIICVYEYDVIG